VKKHTNFKRQTRGYSIVELLVSMAIISVLSAIAVPSLMRTYRSYQMDDAASQVATELKFTRYEAIRRNDPTKCLNNTQNGYLTMYTRNLNAPDDNVHPDEKQIVFSGSATLVDAASVPSSASLPAVVGSGITLTTMSPTNGTITFDGRGAKSTAGVTVYWVGNANYGWRAVTVMHSGSVQVWSYATGTWTQAS
jgi:prepilin-type N-terminal cleavage/methylation domain-containing protein